jgi:hypothetical protein
LGVDDHQSRDPHAVQHYRSEPDLTPSTVTITTPARPGAALGDLFLAPYQGQGAAGPMITDQTGNLIWFHRLQKGLTATNFQVLHYQANRCPCGRAGSSRLRPG